MIMKINSLAILASASVIAAGTYAYVATRPVPVVEQAKVAVAAVPEAPAQVELAKPAEQQVAAAVTPVKPTEAAKPNNPIVPSFDTVRVESNGEAVIAGTAAPGTEVVAKLNGQIVARTKATADGSFVMIPDAALPAGAGTLTLESTTEGKTQVSTQTVAVAVKPQAQGENTVAILTPDAPTKIIQAPKPVSHDVTLDAIDYGETGNILFAGRALANATVRLYVENIFLGDAKADDQGKWNYAGGATVKPGTFTLRLDQMDAKGAVTSRIEVPFKREEPAKAAAVAAVKVDPPPAAETKVVSASASVSVEVAKPTSMTIQPGDNLWVISRNIYGEGRQYTILYEANRALIKNPQLIYPGQIIATPQAATP
jgi:nucleoid-associated protein YgaU